MNTIVSLLLKRLGISLVTLLLVSAVVFLYSPTTTLASIAVLNMDDAGDIAPAAAMGMMIFYTNAAARIIHLVASKGILGRTQAWRNR